MVRSATTHRASIVVRSLCFSLAVALFGPGPLAHADEAEVHVNLRAYDLEKSSDVERLYSHLRLASESACGVGRTTGSNLPNPAWQKCVSRALDQAVARVDRPALSAYHSRKSGRVDATATVAARSP